MATLLLILIYTAFISLGLPDALLGAGWPVMQPEFNVPVGFAGIAQILISGGTIVSSLLSGLLIRRLGTGKLTTISVALTAAALLGFSRAPSFWWILAATLPLGLGAGAVDSGLNSYVANHYESRHMSWLHSFWGIGALGGPLVLSALLLKGFSWRSGYLSVGLFQVLLVLVLLAALPLWKKVKTISSNPSDTEEPASMSLFAATKIKGVKAALLVFLFYCGIEASMGLWGGSYLYKFRGMDPGIVASWVSGFYASITLGRFLTGFFTYKFSNNTMIRGGALIILAGTLLMLLPLPLPVTLCGFILVGAGCAPIFPCMLHETPARFGAKNSQTIVGFQIAISYTGTTILPPLFGFIAGGTSMGLLPIFILGYALLLFISAETLRKATVHK